MTGLSIPASYSPAAIGALLAKQIPGYQKRYGLGQGSSVPSETAGELLRGLLYCMEQAPAMDPGEALTAGQVVLLGRRDQAAELCRLVCATAPEPENRCRWDTVSLLTRWIDGYDYEFLPHRIPPLLDYPLLIPVPEQLRGIDYVLCYVNCLWLENQILGTLPAPPDHWEVRIPDYYGLPLNQCEQPLVNALGRWLLGRSPDSLAITPEDLGGSATVMPGDPAGIPEGGLFRHCNDPLRSSGPGGSKDHRLCPGDRSGGASQAECGSGIRKLRKYFSLIRFPNITVMKKDVAAAGSHASFYSP